MSSFAGVSVLADSELCPATASCVDTGTDCGYHLLVVHDYSRTKKVTPTGDSISSCVFMVGGHGWYIEYFPNGENSGCAHFVSLSLSCFRAEDKKPVEAKFVFTFVDQVEKQNLVYLRQEETCIFAGSSWGSNRFITRDALEQSADLKDDCFTIRCDIMVCSNTEGDVAGAEVALPPDIMCQHFDNLLQTRVGADVEFEVAGETLAAHRCVIAARSKVFMSQLFGPMKEGTTKATVIRIKDMESTVFRDLLSFIYTDSFPDMEDDDAMEEEKMSQVVEQGKEKETPLLEVEMWLQWLQNLFAAADRYDVQRLKIICERQLSQHIGVSPVMSTLFDMSSFAGVSVLADSELCPATESSVGITVDYGYHLLVVHDYSRTKEQARTGEGIRSRPFMVGGHRWFIDYFLSQVVEQGQEEEATEGKMSGVVEQGQEKEAAEDEMWLQWLQDLLVAADRYDVQRLKCICEKHLSEHICVSMVMSTLALAEQHHCEGLKEACFKFIQVQSPSCLQTLMISIDFETYPSVLKELIAKFASNHRN